MLREALSSNRGVEGLREFGLRNLRFFLASGSAALLPAVVAAAWLDRRARAGGLLALLWAVYVVAVGGDYFATRFLLPIQPALAALAACGAGTALGRGRSTGLVLALCLPLALTLELSGAALGPGAGSDAGEARTRHERLAKIRRVDRNTERLGRRQARLARERIPPGALVAAAGIGVLGYETRLRILDLLGLVDPTIARTASAEGGGPPGHRRSNADYVLARRPDFLLIPRRPADPGGALVVQAIRDLWIHPDFDRLYRYDPQLEGYRRRARD